MLSFVLILRQDAEALTALAPHVKAGDQVVLILCAAQIAHPLARQVFEGVVSAQIDVDLIQVDGPISASDSVELGLRQARHVAVVLQDGDRVAPRGLADLRQVAARAALVSCQVEGRSLAASPAVIAEATARYCGSLDRLKAALCAAAPECTTLDKPWVDYAALPSAKGS